MVSPLALPSVPTTLSSTISPTSSLPATAPPTPKVDEISLLTINTSNFFPDSCGGYMVAFAGHKYAVRSPPAFVANSAYIVTSFTLVLECLRRVGYRTCIGREMDEGKTNFVCLNKQDCAIRISCKNTGGSVDCSLGIQLAFSGSDKHLSVLNSWYEVENLRQYFTDCIRI